MQTSTTRSTPPPEAAEYGAGASVAAACVTMFLATMGRPTPDPAGAYTDLKGLYGALGALGTWPWAASVALTHPGGWYALLLAAAIRATGRPEAMYVLATTLWLAVVLGAAAFTALRMAGRIAGAVTAAFVVAVAARPDGGFAAWASLPEAALACVVLAVAVGNPSLDRAGARGVIALAGALLVSSAPAGPLWAVTLLPVLLAGWRWEPHRYWARFVASVAPWALGLAPAIWALTAAPPTLPLAGGTDPVAPPYATALVGVVFLGLAGNLGGAGRLGGAGNLATAARWTLGAWLLLATGLYVLTALDVGDLPLLLPAAAVLTGTGVAGLVRAVVGRVRPMDVVG